MQVGEDERRDGLPAHPVRASSVQGVRDQGLDVVQRIVRRAAEQEAVAAELPVCPRDAGRLVRQVDAPRDGRAARGRVEQRERVDAVAEHGHAQ